MPQRVDHGYTVKRSNEVMRGISLYSGEDRAVSSRDYHRVRVGLKVGANVDWLATWDGSEQRLRAGEPLSVLPDSRRGMRLGQDSIIVVEVTTTGFPASLDGSSVDLDLSLTGGSTLKRRALVSFGTGGGDAVTDVADALNTSGVAEKVVRIGLYDIRAVEEGAFQGRLQMDSTTAISLQRYSGNWIEVDGDLVALGTNGITCSTTDGLLTAGGTLSVTAPSPSTLYYVYVSVRVSGVPSMRLSATAPSRHRGVYYLGTQETTRRWRFVGWVYLNGSTQFADDETNRTVANYYNRVRKNILLRPAYSDGNTATTFTEGSTVWVPANGGTGSTGSYIANGEDGLVICAFGRMVNSNAGVTTRLGIGDNSIANCAASTAVVGTTALNGSCVHSVSPSTAARRTVSLLTSVSANTGTYTVDEARNGSATDPVVTGLSTMVSC